MLYAYQKERFPEGTKRPLTQSLSLRNLSISQAMTAGFLLLLLAVITFHLTRLVSSNLEQTSKLPSNEHPSANSILEQKSSRQRQDQDEDRAKETTEMPSATPSVPPTPTATPTNIPTPTPAIGQPTYIQIPSIGVDAYVEETGYNAEGTTMDVPQDPVNTAWFNAGPVPGYRGNAVIAGHYDNALGQPAAFWYLNQVQIGDDVIIYDNLGQRLRFVVTDVQTYHISNVPLQEIFGSTNSKQLNLITCGGYWDIGANTYSDRTVVYSEFTEEIE